jgi:hypothetical protein
VGTIRIVFVFLFLTSSSYVFGASKEAWIADVATCDDARDEIFKIYSGAPVHTLNAVNAEAFAKASPGLRTRFQQAAARIDSLLSEKSLNALPVTAMAVSDSESEMDPRLHLSRIEMRSQIEPIYQSINVQLDEALNEVRSTAAELGLNCMSTHAEALLTPPTHGGDGRFGALKTMATAYQSCRVLDLAPVTNRVENVQGVIRYVKVDAVGWGRKYTDVDLLKRTHYYHRGESYSGACADQHDQPLVYDYGGSPVLSSAGEIDLFKNNGGGPALGIDCSAFVSTASAVAGNLFKTSTTNHLMRFVSRDFIDPVKSGWSCYKQVAVDGTNGIRSGDIGAVRGHVVMVDNIGADPFGLAKINTVGGCDSIDARGFDFTLIQSSSNQEHLGINRYRAADFLSEPGKMNTLFTTYARAACLSKFDHKSRNPASDAFGMIRHSSSASCVGSPIPLVHEECVASCAK